MAISRILSPNFFGGRSFISSRLRETPGPVGGETVMRRYPRINPEKIPECADRRPSLCSVLHRMGFFVPRELLRER